MATPDALLIDALTQLPEYGGYESAGAGLYPELYPADPSLAPMPSFDGAIGRRSMGDAYGRPLGGMELLGGPIMKPGGDGQRGELDVAAAAGGAPSLDPSNVIPSEKAWPDFGVPFIPPPGPPVAAPVAPPLGPVDLSKIPSDIPLLAPGPSYPGVSAGPAPVPGGLLPPSAPSPHQSYGAPWNRQVVTPTVAQTPDIRQAPGDVTAAPGDVGPEGRSMADRPTPPQDPRDAQPYRPDFGLGGAEAGGFVSHRGDDDDVYKGLNISDDRKAEIETSANNAKDFLYGGGYIDTGQHGFAQSLMLLYGGGLEPTVTQGPAVQFNVRGQPMTTDRYLNFATGGASVPSLLPEGQRLGQVAPSGDVVSTVGGKKSINVTGVSPLTPTGKGGEGKTPLQTFLEGQDNVGRIIPGGLNLDAAVVKNQAAINQLRNTLSERDFEGVDSFEKFGNLFETKLGFQNVSNSITTAIQGLTGMEEGDLKGPGLWNTLNTPIPAFSTGEFGITPLDIIAVIAGGAAAIGPILMHKFMDSLIQPFTSAITGGLKGIFDGVFNRGEQPSGDVSQEDVSAYELAGLANSLGISAPAGMIDAGTYYDAGGNVLATNMKSLDFGLNTVDGANAFKDVLNNIAVKIDPNYKSTYYNYETGQVDVVHADGTVTENASYVTTDSEGNMSQGTSVNKKTSKKVNWGVHVIGVESIDTVAPRRDKGKGKGSGRSIWDWIKDIIGGDDDEKPPEGSKG